MNLSALRRDRPATRADLAGLEARVHVEGKNRIDPFHKPIGHHVGGAAGVGFFGRLEKDSDSAGEFHSV